MAIDAKVSFMDQLKDKLAGILTVEQMGKLESTGYDLLDSFEMYEATEDLGPDDLLDSYVSALQVECRSQKTIDRYAYIINKLMKFAKVPTRRISIYHLRNFIATEKARGIQDTTLEGYREIFTAYFNWLQRETLIEKNPCANLGVIKCAKKEKKIYTSRELERLNRNCENARDRAILHVLRSTGCRISEVSGMNRDQVDLDKLECVVHGKGNKDRIVYMDEVAGMMLSEYLAERKDICPALFIGKGRKRLLPGGIRARLKQLAAMAHVDHVHPHKFRRTLATNLAKHGMPIQEIARVLGHEKIDTTMEYVVLDNETTKNNYRRFA